MVQNFASHIAKQDVSESWVTRFINRHSIKLISQWATGMDQDRHAADSEIKYKLYFDLLEHKIAERGIDARHIYNMDEKGFMLGIVGRSKRVFSKAMYKQKRVRESLQDGNREWITLLATVCADGTALSPGIIFQSANSTLQSSWVDSIKPGKHSVYVSSSPSGWTNNDIGLAWLEQVFDRETKAKARSAWRLLILDGHGSHVTQDFINYCDENKILLCVFPPHSTQTLQPLDVVMFKPLSTAYSSELAEHLQRAQGLLPVKKGDFFDLFWRAWCSSFVEKNVLSAFKHTGITPLDRDVIMKRFVDYTPEATSSRESSTSILSGDDWRKLDRLVRSTVTEQGAVESRKLRSSLHHIAIQNELLRAEIEGLRDALVVKKRHNKKSKVLNLQQRGEYHGGAVFWSPRKIREAQYRERVQQQLKQDEELQKVEMKELKEAARLYKQKIEIEKRVAREADRAAKAQAKAEQIATKKAEKEARNTAKAIQLSQKGKRKASRAPTAKNKRPKSGGRPAAFIEATCAAPAAPTQTTRTGRTTRLPRKFK